MREPSPGFGNPWVKMWVFNFLPAPLISWWNYNQGNLFLLDKRIRSCKKCLEFLHCVAKRASKWWRASPSCSWSKREQLLLHGVDTASTAATTTDATAAEAEPGNCRFMELIRENRLCSKWWDHPSIEATSNSRHNSSADIILLQ